MMTVVKTFRDQHSYELWFRLRRFIKKKFNEVVALLKPTLLTFEKEPGPNDSFADYLEALAYLGASYVSLGYGGDAKDAFRNLATLTVKALG